MEVSFNEIYCRECLSAQGFHGEKPLGGSRARPFSHPAMREREEEHTEDETAENRPHYDRQRR